MVLSLIDDIVTELLEGVAATATREPRLRRGFRFFQHVMKKRGWRLDVLDDEVKAREPTDVEWGRFLYGYYQEHFDFPDGFVPFTWVGVVISRPGTWVMGICKWLAGAKPGMISLLANEQGEVDRFRLTRVNWRTPKPGGRKVGKEVVEQAVDRLVGEKVWAKEVPDELKTWLKNARSHLDQAVHDLRQLSDWVPDVLEPVNIEQLTANALRSAEEAKRVVEEVGKIWGVI